MATYVIGDIHGCYDQLQSLIGKINFDPAKDVLWFTGDLINGGPKPAEVIRFIKSLGDKQVCVLGNHDLVLLALAAGKITPHNDRKIGFSALLEAPDSAELISWLRMRPIVHYDAKFNTLLVHAGVLPQWNLPEILKYAHEIEELLHGEQCEVLYENMFGNKPDAWSESLSGWPKIRFLINCFVRMRFCTPGGRLDLTTKGDMTTALQGYHPWFKLPRRHDDIKIVFGHWAALQGRTDVANAIAIDTGCVWGHSLSAICLDTGAITSVTNA